MRRDGTTKWKRKKEREKEEEPRVYLKKEEKEKPRSYQATRQHKQQTHSPPGGPARH